MTYSDHMISFPQIGSHLAYGDLYKIEIDGAVGCVAIEYVQKRRLLAKELLIPTDKKMAKAVETIAKEMEASRYHIRTPAFWDGLPGSYTQAFGMIKWYDMDLHAKYFGPAGCLSGPGLRLSPAPYAPRPLRVWGVLCSFFHSAGRDCQVGPGAKAYL